MFLVFTGMEFYPSGGWEDFAGEANSLEEARVIAETKSDGSDDWYHIVDTTSGKIVDHGDIEDTTTYDPYEEKRKLVPTDEHGFSQQPTLPLKRK
jgi:hypothetical protein